MFSIIITVQGLELMSVCIARQYAQETETKLSHGEGYGIPSLIWPPPVLQIDPVLSRSFMTSLTVGELS